MKERVYRSEVFIGILGMAAFIGFILWIDLHCQRDDPVFVSKINERGWLIYEA